MLKGYKKEGAEASKTLAPVSAYSLDLVCSLGGAAWREQNKD